MQVQFIGRTTQTTTLISSSTVGCENIAHTDTHANTIEMSTHKTNQETSSEKQTGVFCIV